MKKEYFKPTVKTIRMRADSMLAASPTNPGEGNPGGQPTYGGGSSKEEGDDIGW